MLTTYIYRWINRAQCSSCRWMKSVEHKRTHSCQRVVSVFGVVIILIQYAHSISCFKSTATVPAFSPKVTYQANCFWALCAMHWLVMLSGVTWWKKTEKQIIFIHTDIIPLNHLSLYSILLCIFYFSFMLLTVGLHSVYLVTCLFITLLYLLLLYSFLTLFYYCCTTISLGMNKVFLNLESWMTDDDWLFFKHRWFSSGLRSKHNCIKYTMMKHHRYSII